MGLNRKKLILIPIPNSDRFNRPNMLNNVPVSPMKSAPRLSKNIFLEKKVTSRVRK